MKVLLVGTQIDDFGGGAAAVVRQLAEGLRRRDIKVVVVGSQRESRSRVATWGEDIKVYTFRPRNLYWIGDKDVQRAYKKAAFHVMDLWNPQVYRELRTIIEREQPDVVHVHKLRGLSPSVWAAARQAGVKRLVHTCHDYELLSPEGTLSGGLGRRAVQGSGIFWPYQAPRRFFSRAVTTVTAPSHFTLERHTSLNFFSEAAQLAIPNSHGLMRSALDNLRTEIESDRMAFGVMHPVRLLYLGRLDPPKGVDILCAAFEGAVNSEPALHLDIAGWGTLLDSLRIQYAHVPNLVFHGPVQGEKKKELLRGADALIVPSNWAEVFGIVIVEAYAYGKPVIAAAIGAIPELVQSGKTGYLFPPGDIDALAARLISVAKTPGNLHDMVPACLLAAKSYTLDSVVDQYLAAYETP